MKRSYFGRVFAYDTNKTRLENFRCIFENRGFLLFGTDNIYQLLRYTNEIKPDVIIFHVDEDYNPIRASISRLVDELNSDSPYPIVVIKPKEFSFISHQGIAHYLHSPFDLEKLVDIIESYCIGHKQHHLMLLDSYYENCPKFSQQLQKSPYKYFEVHNESAARLYLSKNEPKAVCIECSQQFVRVPPQISHSKIFYVDREEDIAEIKKFLR